jgi:hypothetical protein
MFSDRLIPQDKADRLSKNFKEKRFAGMVKRYYLCPPGLERVQQNHKISGKFSEE